MDSDFTYMTFYSEEERGKSHRLDVATPEEVRLIVAPCQFTAWGVFNMGTSSIPPGTFLGFYVGDIHKLNGRKVPQDGEYIMETDQYIIDAKHRGNWSRFLNTSSSQRASNVEAFENSTCLNQKDPKWIHDFILKLKGYEVVLFVKKEIKPRDQLLLFYGDEYLDVMRKEDGIGKKEINATAKQCLSKTYDYGELVQMDDYVQSVSVFQVNKSS